MESSELKRDHLDIWVVRHGETEGNALFAKWRQDNNSTHDRSIPVGKEVKFFREHIDTLLNANGEEQAKSAGVLLRDQPTSPKVIFTSPLKRALQTTQLILESLGSQEIERVIVLPIIREILSSSNDIPDDIRVLRKEYSAFDWSAFDEFEAKAPNDLPFWALELGCAEDCENLKAILRKLKAERAPTFEENLKKMHDQILQRMDKIYPDPVERGRFVLKRTKTFKDYLVQKFLKEKEYKDGEIVVVTHAVFLLYFLAKEENIHPETKEVSGILFPVNGKPVNYSLALTE